MAGGAASLRMTRRGAAARDKKQNAVSVSFTVLYFTPNKLRITPLSPTCHPERSGTPGVGANATTEQRRAVEPRPPGGAPAGGISVVPTRPRNAPRPPGTRTQRGEALWTTFACFALIRHWRATFPTRGKAFWAVRGVMWCHLASEIPPAGAPLGAGFAVRRWLVGALDFWRVVPLRSG